MYSMFGSTDSGLARVAVRWDVGFYCRRINVQIYSRVSAAAAVSMTTQ